MQRDLVFGVARAWIDRSVSVFPCLPRSKYPAVAWKPYQDALPSREQVESWFGSGSRYNLAVIGGGVNHLAILDFDELPRYFAWRRAHPVEAATYTVETPRGRHVYFFLDAPAATQYADGFELRSRGAYVLAVPSVHPSGAVYQAVDAGATILHATLDTILGRVTPCIRELPTRAAHTQNTRYAASENRDDLIGEIRASLPILNYCARFTNPIASSTDGRWFIARCVFPENHRNGDKHPSMWIDTQRNKCGCFAPKCRAQHRTMDVIDLFAALHRLSNRDAVFALARELDLLAAPVFGASEVTK